MNIQNIKDSSFLTQTLSNSSISKKSHASNPLTQAIKDYKDEYLTGLTDEERERIEQEIRGYLNTIPEGQKADPNKLRDLVSHLLKQYGFKGNVDDMYQTLLGDVEKESEGESTSSQDATIAYDKLKNTGTTHAVAPDDLLLSKAPAEETTSHIITNADGSRSLVITRNKTIISTVRLTSKSDTSAYLAPLDIEETGSLSASTMSAMDPH